MWKIFSASKNHSLEKKYPKIEEWKILTIITKKEVKENHTIP